MESRPDTESPRTSRLVRASHLRTARPLRARPRQAKPQLGRRLRLGPAPRRIDRHLGRRGGHEPHARILPRQLGHLRAPRQQLERDHLQRHEPAAGNGRRQGIRRRLCVRAGHLGRDGDVEAPERRRGAVGRGFRLGGRAVDVVLLFGGFGDYGRT